MSTKLIFTILTFLLQALILFGQNSDDENSMSKLSFIVGEWHGKEWMMTKNGKQLSEVTEIAECKQNCNIIIVTGLGIKTDSLTNKSQTVHDAFGVISFDKKAGKYMMRAYRNGEATDSELKIISDKKIQWDISTSTGGKVRFTTDFNIRDKWTEIGEFSQDEVKWMKMMEMELVKKM